MGTLKDGPVGAGSSGKGLLHGGLKLGLGGKTARTPKPAAGPYDLPGHRKASNQPYGKGKMPGGESKQIAQGAAITPSSKKVGIAGALKGSVGGARRVSPRSVAVGKSPSNSPHPSSSMAKRILGKPNGDRFSTSAGTATPYAKGTFGKAPKAPKATGVGITPAVTNWHTKLGFGGSTKP